MLPPLQKKVIQEFCLRGKDVTVIGQDMNITEKAVYCHRKLGLQKFTLLYE